MVYQGSQIGTTYGMIGTARSTTMFVGRMGCGLTSQNMAHVVAIPPVHVLDDTYRIDMRFIGVFDLTPTCCSFVDNSEGRLGICLTSTFEEVDGAVQTSDAFDGLVFGKGTEVGA